MKRYYIIIPLMMVIFLASCEKYLDVKTESRQSFIETPQDCQLVLDNYTVMNTNYPTDGEASAGDYFLDESSYLSSNLSQEERGIYLWNNTVIRGSATSQWTPSYFIAYNANLVLEAVERMPGTTDKTTTDPLKGAALFYRAYTMWQIAQIYAKPYMEATAGQDLGIPIRLTSDINEKSTRGTVKQTYDRILQDLNEAVALLPNTSIVATRPNKVAALAMLARVYLSMEKYAEAQTSANSALQIKSDLIDFNTLNKASTTPFSPRFNKEVIFHSVTTMTYMLYGGFTSFNFSKIDPALAASYDINDLRKDVFLEPLLGTPVNYMFTGNYEPTTGGTLFNGLAVDELYLVRAECYARTGNIQKALDDLNTLLVTRWKVATDANGNVIKDVNGKNVSTYVPYATADVNVTLGYIITERRKELLMRGQRWTDLRRLNRDSRFAATLSRTMQGTTYTLPPNDPRYILLIPKEVIQNGGYEQNSR